MWNLLTDIKTVKTILFTCEMKVGLLLYPKIFVFKSYLILKLQFIMFGTDNLF